MQKKSKPAKHVDAEPAWSLAEARELLFKLKGAQAQSVIADATGINQGQISRLLSGQFVRVRGNALHLCKYAEKVLRSSSTPTTQLRQRLVSSALSLWDGSEVSAARTIALLEALKPIVKASAPK